MTGSVNVTTSVGGATASSTVTPILDIGTGKAGVSGSANGEASTSAPAIVNATVPGGTGTIINGAKDAAKAVTDTVTKAADKVNEVKETANTVSNGIKAITGGLNQKSENSA